MEKIDWESAATTDIGTVRQVNEDDCLEAPLVGMWCVADGMGGHDKGDVASRMIVDYLNCLNTPDHYPITPGQIKERLQSVNSRLVDMAAQMPTPSVVGSTVVVLAFDDHHAHCVWAGDSRIYRLRQSQLTRLTRDHSQVEEMVQAGLLSEEDAESHPSANVITRAVGASDELELDVASFPLVIGDVFLLCSDGLNKVMNDDEIAASLRVCPINTLPDTLISTALERQARDNVTVVAVKYLGPEGKQDPLIQTHPLEDTLPLR